MDGTHAYHQAKRYTLTHSVLCTCPSVFAAGSASKTFAVSPASACPPPKCSFDIDIEPDSPAISAAPAMPSITVRANNVDPPSATISWTADVSHTVKGSSCTGGPTFSAKAEDTGETFSPHFGDGIHGGELTITARCSAPGYDSSTVRQSVTVDGVQPTDAAIIAQIGTVESPFDGPDLRRIACHESCLTQFDPSPGPPVTGRGPAGTTGKGGDIGIMQICWERQREHLWNWRSNVGTGRTTLDTSRKSAKNHLEKEKKKEGATPYTTEMWRKEAIHRYNAGTRSSVRYWEWKKTGTADDDPWDWVAVALGGTPGYVGAVLKEGASCR